MGSYTVLCVLLHFPVALINQFLFTLQHKWVTVYFTKIVDFFYPYIISSSWWKWWRNTWKTTTRSAPPRWSWCSSWMLLSMCAVSAASCASPWAMPCYLEWVGAGASHSLSWPHICEIPTLCTTQQNQYGLLSILWPSPHSVIVHIQVRIWVFPDWAG